MEVIKESFGDDVLYGIKDGDCFIFAIKDFSYSVCINRVDDIDEAIKFDNYSFVQNGLLKKKIKKMIGRLSK